MSAAAAPKKLQVVCEGRTDRLVLAELRAAGFLPDWCEPVEPPDPKGIEGVAQALAERVRGGIRTVVMRDADDRDPAGAVLALFDRARAAAPDVSFAECAPEGSVFRSTAKGDNGDVEVAVVVVGADGDPGLAKLGVASWAIDDYLLRLVLDPAAYGAFAASEKTVEPDHGRVLHKTGELQELFKSNGMPLGKSKRYLHLIRAIVDFGASPPVFAQVLVRRVCKGLPEARVETLLSPWLGDLRRAIEPGR
jgi:hypothetical protein